MPESASYRRRMWGLSMGVIFLAVAGAFWFYLAAFSGGFHLASFLLLAVGTASLAAASFRLIRRKAGAFRIPDTEPLLQQQNQRLLSRFRWVTLLEVLFCFVGVFLCRRVGRRNLITTAVALVVSLHFIPLARLYRFSHYYATSVLGCVVCILSVGQTVAMRPFVLGLGMGAVLWGTACFKLSGADRIVKRSIA